MQRLKSFPCLLAGLLFAVALDCSAAEPISIRVDATSAPRNVLHAELVLPVEAGPLTLLYPKYIPGEHGPTGPIANLAGLVFKADGNQLAWHRDPVDMWTIHVQVPEGVTRLTMALDFLAPVAGGQFTSGGSTTPMLAVINWNQLLLYPAGTRAHSLKYQPSLVLPEGWKYATALQPQSSTENTTEFEPVSLETLVDSPVIAGRYLERYDLAPGQPLAHHLNVLSDVTQATVVSDDTLTHLRNLVTQAGLLFGSHHYRHYDFLLTVSDHVQHFGLEHHESSDDRTGEKLFLEEDAFRASAGLLPHEFVHSWNGKFRRPQGLATPDYEQPMQTELLWVYEGLTTYLGDLLTARSGLWSTQDYQDYLALSAAEQDHRKGRSWRALQDTATGAPFTYGAPRDRSSWRRSVDFYREGELIWLEADATIRKLSDGARSLDDFVARFYGVDDGNLDVHPYTFEDVVANLNAVAPFDWAGFLRRRLDRTDPGAPLAGLEMLGRRLAYGDTMTDYQKAIEKRNKSVTALFSIGINLNKEATIVDVLAGSPAALAGLAAGMKLIAVDQRAYTPEGLRAAIESSPEQHRLKLLTAQAEQFQSFDVSYDGGLRYPHLERVDGSSDGLSKIIEPRE